MGKIYIKIYAKSSAIATSLCVESYAKITSNQADQIRSQQKLLYKTDRDSNQYHTVQDEVVEVLTKEQHKSLLSSYYEYID